jgi:hypothetical protein
MRSSPRAFLSKPAGILLICQGIRGTYERYPYDSVPDLSHVRLRGNLHWLEYLDKQMQQYRPASEERTKMVQTLKHLMPAAQKLGLTLPDTFLHMMASPELQDRIPSCTACSFDLAERIVPCPGSENGYLIRFLDEWCLLWYLYLTPQSEQCVAVTHTWLDDPSSQGEDRLDDEELIKDLYLCAPSFEAFLYRFWLENTCWYSLYEHKALTQEQQRYLAHYASQPGSTATDVKTTFWYL